MRNLTIDTGVQEFTVNGGGVLRFNPGDPNLYHRFFAAQAELLALDAELSTQLAALEADTQKTEAERAGAALGLLAGYDGKIKAMLGRIFGAQNDFDTLLAGVNLAAVGSNGQRVVQNLLAVLTPILQAGAQRTVQAKADAALAEAEAERMARGQTA